MKDAAIQTVEIIGLTVTRDKLLEKLYEVGCPLGSEECSRTEFKV